MERKVPYSWFFSNRRSIFGLITCSFVCLIYSFYSGFLVNVLQDEKHVDPKYNGIIISSQSLFYVLSTILVGYVIDKLPKRVFIALSFTGCTISLFIMGPSNLLGLPNDLWIFILGYALSGASLGLVFIPILPEVIDSIYIKKGLIEGEDEYLDGVISDKAAGLYGSFYSTGMILSPLFGSFVYSRLKNFNNTCDVIAIMTLVYTIIYVVFNVAFDIRKDDEEQNKINEELEDQIVHQQLHSPLNGATL